MALGGANLQGANLWADLQGADLGNANLQGANLTKSDLRGIENWLELMGIRLANVYKVKNPPEGFLKWAKENGAVAMEFDEEWQAEKEGR